MKFGIRTAICTCTQMLLPKLVLVLFSMAVGFSANGWTEFPLSNCPLPFLELFPIILSLRLWGNSLQDKRVIFWFDNEAVISRINQQTSRCSHIMQLVCRFVVKCLMLNIHFKALHVPGFDNSIADALSQFQMVCFRQPAFGVDPVMTPLPVDLWNNFN